MSKKNGYFYFTCSLLVGSFYLTRPLLLGEAPHPLLNTLASPKSFTLGNVQMHLTLLSLNQDFPLLRREGLKAWPAGPVRANKLSP